MKHNLTFMPTTFQPAAIMAFESGDGMGFVHSTGSHETMAMVCDNLRELKTRGIFEAALVAAYSGAKSNLRGWSPTVLKSLFAIADREKLRASGEPLPGPGPFTLYRGVCGIGRARRVRGFSWTDDLDVACWFAACHMKPAPAVFMTSADAADVLLYTNDRGEREFVLLPRKPKNLHLTVEEIRRRHGTFAAGMMQWESEALAKAMKRKGKGR